MQTRLTGTLVAATLAVLWAGSASGQELALGYLPSGAGPFATFSKTNEIAAQIAIDEINAAGGIAGKRLRIVAFDTAGKPDQAVVGVRKLADDDKVLAIIGPFSSSECRVVFPAADRAGVVSMSMASSAPKLAEPFQYAFRNTSDESYMFERVMRALKQKNLAIATGAIAYATDDVISKVMGENVLPGIMKKAGTDVKLSVTFQTQAFDFSAQVSQLVGQPTDLIGVGSGPEPATRLAQEQTICRDQWKRVQPHRPPVAVQGRHRGNRTSCRLQHRHSNHFGLAFGKLQHAQELLSPPHMEAVFSGHHE